MPDDIEVVDVEVPEDAAGAGNVVVVRGVGIVARHPHDVDPSEVAPLDQLARPAIAGIEAALEAHLHHRVTPLDVADHRVGGREVDGDGLLAEGGTAGVGGLAEEIGVGVGRAW